MLGLTVLLALGIYLTVSALVIWLVVRWAKKRGRRGWVWGGVAAFAIYNLVFWDWIPTVAMHKYYCSTEAGFWVYKTPEQWVKENPGVMETLVDNSPYEEYPNWPTENWRGKEIASINQRFGMLYTSHLSSVAEDELFLNVWRWRNELVDKKTGEILVRHVDFSAGNGYIGGDLPVKFWIQYNHCSDKNEYADRFGELLKQFGG